MIIVAILERPVLETILTDLGLAPRAPLTDRPGESMPHFAGQDGQDARRTYTATNRTAARDAGWSHAPSRHDAAIETPSPSTSSRLEPTGPVPGTVFGLAEDVRDLYSLNGR